MDRLNPLAVWRGHWVGMRDRESLADGSTTSTPDHVARAVILLVPAGVAIAMGPWRGVELQAPAVLVGGLSLFSAGLLAAFAQIASIRGRYVVPDDPRYDSEKPTRDMLDEAVGHILFAALLSIVTVVTVIVGMNIDHSTTAGAATAAAQAPPPPPPPEPGSMLGTRFSAAVGFLGSYLVILFAMTVRKLYGAYIIANEVSDDVGGHIKGPRV